MIESELKLGDIRTIVADVAPLHYKFVSWSGDTPTLNNPNLSTAIVTMPAEDVEVTANYVWNEVEIKFGYLYNWYATQYSINSNINYGYLYNWYTGVDSRKISSSNDWIVPSNTQLVTLQTYLGGASVAGGKLKEIGLTHWNSPNSGATNEVGFNAIGAGYRNNINNFEDIKRVLYLWNTNDHGSGGFAAIDSQTAQLITGIACPKNYGLSIRLLYIGSDSPTTYTGNDGKTYPVVLIGTQRWISVNLMETYYRDGSPISEVTGNAAWNSLTTGGRCSYENNESNAGGVDSTIITSSNAWVVSSNNDWTTLINYLGGASVAGGKLKETGLTHWNSPNIGATNEVGFNGKGSGIRLENGNFYNINTNFYIFTSDQYDIDRCISYSILNNDDLIHLTNYSNEGGGAIRLIKTSTTLTHGQTGIYVGNDGKVYKTICIGTQEWLADNLAETKYRGGNSIPNVSGNTEWSTLTTGARCAHNNDKSNVDDTPTPNVSVTYGYYYDLFVAMGLNYIYDQGIPHDRYPLYGTVDTLAPIGWRIPLAADWYTLLGINAPAVNTGTNSVIVPSLQTIGTDFWLTANGNNSLNFSLTGSAGFSYNNANPMQNLKNFFYTWVGANYAYPNISHIKIQSESFNVLALAGMNFYNGMALRLIKEDSNDVGYMVGNDGKVYPTTKIGGQVWLAVNLLETKYRNGTNTYYHNPHNL